MDQSQVILNVIIDRAITNVQGCINNTTDITRATAVGEKAWHVHKYTGPLVTDKLNLEEDLQLISNLASNGQVTILGSKVDYQKLDAIVANWSRINQDRKRVVPFKKIKQILEQMKNKC